MVYTELNLVEKPIIEWLQELGWRYVAPDELKREPEETFDLPTLRAFIKKLNPELSDDDIEKVINQLRRPTNDINGNKDFFEWLKGEKPIALKAAEKARSIKLIDFDNIDNNKFVLTNQFKFAGYQNVRFDIVLIVNGLPIVVIEAKVPTKELMDYHEAIKQIQRYHREAPQVFKYLAFTCVTDGATFRYNWISSDSFFEWKAHNLPDPIEGSVKGLFSKERFLDFISNFIVFEKERQVVRKKIARYQQYLAVNKIVKRALDGKVKTGLIWHTQGSGKTLTMLLAAWKLKKIPQLHNPTILVIVDRIDLESQAYGQFANVDLPYTSKALSTKDLIKKLKGDSREVIITTIQKFEEIKEVMSKRENIIVFIDEAHRSQYGKLAMSMRQALPNAILFGFTGTPIDKGPLGKSTFRTFCPPREKYLDKYSVKQSIEDGATVRILYLPRLVEYQIPKEILDKEFFEKTKELTDEEQDVILERSATLKTALKAKDRMSKIAKDIAEHYTRFVEPNGCKAQLVGADREACALYKEALDKYLPEEYSTVIYTPGANDSDLLRKYHKTKDEQINISKNLFQDKSKNPKILIVTDMLLTGFDAPIEQVMYLDKPLRDHKLLQAIARTNRPYSRKEVGIVVDYVGIFSNLVKALNFEEEDIQDVAYDFDVLKKEFKDTMSSLLLMFKGVRRDDTRESFMQVMSILENERNAKRFKEMLSKLRRLYETISPDHFLIDYEKYYAWLIEVNAAYNKFFNRKEFDLSEYEEKTKQLIREKLLVKKVDTTLPTLEINKDYLKNLEKTGYSDEHRVMEMRQALSYHIKINLETNPVYETLGERLEKILKKKSRSEVLKELEGIVNEVVKIDEETKKLGISREEFALMNVIKKHVNDSEDKLVQFVKELAKDVKKKVFPGWQEKASVVKEVEKAVFDNCFDRYRDELEIGEISNLTEEMMKFVRQYNK